MDKDIFLEKEKNPSSVTETCQNKTEQRSPNFVSNPFNKFKATRSFQYVHFKDVCYRKIERTVQRRLLSLCRFTSIFEKQ